MLYLHTSRCWNSYKRMIVELALKIIIICTHPFECCMYVCRQKSLNLKYSCGIIIIMIDHNLFPVLCRTHNIFWFRLSPSFFLLIYDFRSLSSHATIVHSFFLVQFAFVVDIIFKWKKLTYDIGCLNYS